MKRNFKWIFALAGFFIFSNALYSETQDISKKAKFNTTGPIIAGAGFSHDTQQIPTNLCYNISEASHSGQQALIKLNTAISFADLQKQLHIKIDADGDFGMFSSSAEADYLRTIQDLSYSLSLNYYEYLYNTVSLHLDGIGQNALSKIGKDIYANLFSNFGILCGDDFISSYQQGALLLMGINVRFASHLDKEEFMAKASGGWGDIVHASTEIQRLSSQYQMRGSVIIQAFQKGGEPEELSKILSKDESGVYYALSCDIQHMENCVKAASGLMNYAANHFQNQISFYPEKGLTPLGVGFISHEPIVEYGVEMPPSLVTENVRSSRDQLAELLEENQYYQQKFNEFLYGYPVPLEKSGPIYTQAQKLYLQAGKNIDAILMPENPDDGGIKCFTHPTQCHQVVSQINAKVRPITPQLDFLKPLSFKIKLSAGDGYWYPNDRNQFLWFEPSTGWHEGMIEVTDNFVNVIRLPMVVSVRTPMGHKKVWVDEIGNLAKQEIDYLGNLCWHYEHSSDCYSTSARLYPNSSSILPYSKQLNQKQFDY